MSENTTSPISPQRQQPRAWGFFVSAICTAGFVIARVVDLDMHAHPEKSLTNIWITDVGWSIVMLLAFSLFFGLFAAEWLAEFRERILRR
jgi:hypothetical protein